ncbi:MAG: TraR/DksA C4-type zinc finger protein [Ferruginibacter sp.]
MATKKNAPSKKGKEAVKPAVKKSNQPSKSLLKSGNKSAKAAPAKKVTSKKAAPSKKVIAKPVAKKQVAKPVAKKNAKPIAKAAKPVIKTTKPAVKAAVKKAAPAKKLPQPTAKQITKSPVPAKKVPVKTVSSAPKIMAKKEEITKPVAKPAAEKKAVPANPVAAVKAKDIKVPAPKPVVIPKIATKTVRKYQPEFTKSVLDKSQRDTGAPSQRYSDGELLEFRELIQRKLEAAKKELSYLHGLITRKDEMGGDEGDNRYMTMEDGSLSMEREQLSQMASRQITFIDHLEKAVMRIENKTYGICRVTGKLIDKARLRAVPHATLSIEAKMGATK